MESIDKSYKEYSLSSLISDICALLNTDGGIITIHETDDKIHDAIVNKWKELEPNYYIMNEDGRLSFASLHLQNIVSIRKQKRKSNVSTIIEVKPVLRDDWVVVFDVDPNIYYFLNGKKIAIDDTENNIPFRSELIKSGKWRLPHAYKTPLRDMFSYTMNLRDIQKKNNVSYYWLDDILHLDFLYKYMSLDAAMLCLNNSNICFKQPSCWDDQYEKRFYDARYVLNNMTFIPTHLFACCFTTRQDSEAAWHIYSHNDEFSKSIVVEFKLNFQKLLEQLIFHLNDCDLFVGKVKYLDKKVIDNIHKPKINSDKLHDDREIDNPYYYHFFDKFSRDSFLHLLLLKRDAFEHEQEIRFFIVPKSQEALERIKLVNINWIDLIEHVRIDGKATDKEKDELENKLNLLLEKKKRKVNSGIKKMKTAKNQEDFLSNSFVHASWEVDSAEEAQKSNEMIIKEYFNKLKNKITPIVYNVYSSNSDVLTITINN